jgi:precorrin-8X/cobalt-precorrin-8 methylmutase
MPAPDGMDDVRKGRELVSSWLEGRGLSRLSKAVVEAVVAATADPFFIDDLVVSEEAVVEVARAMRQGFPAFTDVRMVEAGLRYPKKACFLPPVAPPGSTRSYAGMMIAARAHPSPLVVVGCAPTALSAVLDSISEGSWAPAGIVATPVGLIGAESVKARARELTGIPVISNRSPRGGAAVACAIANAIYDIAVSDEPL